MKKFIVPIVWWLVVALMLWVSLRSDSAMLNVNRAKMVQAVEILQDNTVILKANTERIKLLVAAQQKRFDESTVIRRDIVENHDMLHAMCEKMCIPSTQPTTQP